MNANLTDFERKHDVNRQYEATQKESTEIVLFDPRQRKRDEGRAWAIHIFKKHVLEVVN